MDPGLQASGYLYLASRQLDEEQHGELLQRRLGLQPGSGHCPSRRPLGLWLVPHREPRDVRQWKDAQNRPYPQHAGYVDFIAWAMASRILRRGAIHRGAVLEPPGDVRDLCPFERQE